MQHQARSILVIDASPFGRSVALLPVLRALRAANPKSFIAAATSSGACELLTASGLIDEAIDLGVIKSSGGGLAAALKRSLRIIKSSHRKECDLVLDFTPRLETGILSRLVLRARTVTPLKLPNAIEALLGKSGRGGELGGTDYKNALRQIGIDVGEMRLAIELTSDENNRFEELLSKKGSRGGEPVVVLHGAGGERGWPATAFVELAARLSNLGARIVVADEPSDDNFTDAAMAGMPERAIKLRAPRAMELAAAVARASVVVTDERWLARLAVDLGTPVLEIANAEDAARLSDSHRIVSGAWRARISTDEVYELACEMLQESRTHSLFHR